jgi:hypothetical protein
MIEIKLVCIYMIFFSIRLHLRKCNDMSFHRQTDRHNGKLISLTLIFKESTMEINLNVE